jgi:outer membrane receptor protein involved in Fe transport
VFLAVVLLLPQLGYAQTASEGTISGTVSDSTGAVLPGARVTVSGIKLTGQKTVYTNESGDYRVVTIPLGGYNVTFEMDGFRTVVRENIMVTPRTTTRVDAEMQLAAVAETLTIVGEAPQVDVKSSVSKTSLTQEFLGNIPETFGSGSDILNLAPTAVTGSGQGTPSFAGSSPAGVAWQADGIDLTDPGGGSQWTFYDYDYVESAEFVTYGAPAEYGKFTGAVFNVVTKSGGSEFHGGVKYFYSNDSLLSDNTSNFPELAESAPSVETFWDFSATIGGPIKKDVVHFFASALFIKHEETDPGCEVVTTDHSKRGLQKVTWQLNDNNRVIGQFIYDQYPVTGRIYTCNSGPDTVVTEPSFSWNPAGTYQHIFSQNTFMEARFQGYNGYFDLIPQNNLPAIYDVDQGAVFQSYFAKYTFDRGRVEGRADLNHYADQWAGTHDFKFGYAYEWSYSTNTGEYGTSTITGDHIYYLASEYYAYLGYPGGIYYAYLREPYLTRSVNKVSTIYAQDDWTIGDRLTVNLGLRYDRSIGSADHAGRNDPLVKFDSFAPRLGFSFDLTGDTKTELRAFYGRYYDSIFGSTYAPFDFGVTPKFAAFVTGPGEYEIVRLVSDPLGVVTGEPTIGIDPNLENQYADEIDVGVERQLWENASISVTYVHKRERNLFGGTNRLAVYEPTTIQDPGPDNVLGTADDGGTLNVFHRVNPSENLNILENKNGLYRDYDGLDLIFTKRWSNNWSLLASLIFQKSEGTATNRGFGAQSGGTTQLNNYNSPNDLINIDGTLPNSRPYIFKLNASYRIPDPIGVLISGNIESFKGETFTRTLSIRSAAGESQTIFAEQRGSRRMPTLNRVNLRLEKQFDLPGSFWNGRNGGTLGLNVDMFNLFNDDSPIDIVNGSGGAFGDAIQLNPARKIRFGVRYLW